MSNVAFLTAGSAVYSKKKAKKRAGVEELTFNPEERRNYLTGFHKRKAERQQKAAEHAKEQARKEKLETRKEIREARKADLEKRLKAIDATSSDNEQAWTDKEGTQAANETRDSIWQSHFEDAEQMTTVTVVEDFDQIGLANADLIPKSQPEKTIPPPPEKARNETHDAKKKKKKSFRYGTKAERQNNLLKAKLKSLQKPRKHRK